MFVCLKVCECLSSVIPIYMILIRHNCKSVKFELMLGVLVVKWKVVSCKQAKNHYRKIIIRESF